MMRYFSCSCFLLFFSYCSYAQVNNVAVFDDYEVHYSLFNTSFLTPDIAQTYNIVRSKSKGLINVSVLKKDGDKKISVAATVTGEQYDLIRYESLDFFMVTEQEAYYSLAQFDIAHKTTIYYTMLIYVDEKKEPYTLKFSKLMYKDE